MKWKWWRKMNSMNTLKFYGINTQWIFESLNNSIVGLGFWSTFKYHGPVFRSLNISTFQNKKCSNSLPQDLYHVTSQYIPIKSYLIMPKLLDHELTRVQCFSYTNYWSLTCYIDTICTHPNPSTSAKWILLTIKRFCSINHFGNIEYIKHFL